MDFLRLCVAPWTSLAHPYIFTFALAVHPFVGAPPSALWFVIVSFGFSTKDVRSLSLSLQAVFSLWWPVLARSPWILVTHVGSAFCLPRECYGLLRTSRAVAVEGDAWCSQLVFVNAFRPLASPWTSSVVFV